MDYGKIDIQSGASFDPRTWGPVATGAAVTLENTVNFPSSGYQKDFSKADLSSQQWLVHEVGHVYQYQNNSDYSWVKAAAVSRPRVRQALLPVVEQHFIKPLSLKNVITMPHHEFFVARHGFSSLQTLFRPASLTSGVPSACPPSNSNHTRPIFS